MKRQILLLAFASFFMVIGRAQQQAGDTIRMNGKVYKLLSTNLIANPGFESGFTGWTDATASAATLTTVKFTNPTTGGVNNSKYLVGTTNENGTSAGSIGTGWKIDAGKSYLFFYSVKYQTASTPAASEAWLKVSLTNNKTNGLEPMILLGSAAVGDAGQWTQNSVLFTNSSSYTYIQARFRWLGGRLGFDNFGLYEANEIPDVVGLQQTIRDAEAIYKTEGNGAAALKAAIDAASVLLTSTSPTLVKQAISDLQKAITLYQYANASAENPLNMTHFIVNQGFDSNSTGGWTGVGVVNYHEVEFYEKTFDMNQQISGLPAGKYRLKAKGFERPKSNDAGAAYKAGTETINAQFYAKATDFPEKTILFNSIYKHTYAGSGAVGGYVNTMAGAEVMLTNTVSTFYETVLTDILLNEGGTLTIGAKSSFYQTGTWVLFDHFRLEYLGNYDLNDMVKAVQASVAEAHVLLTKKLQFSAVDSLNRAIVRSEQILAAVPLVYADVLAAKNGLTNAIALANTSFNAYALLQKAIDQAYRILGFLDKQLEIDKLQTAIDTAKVRAMNQSLTLAEINKAASDLKAVTKSVGKQIYIPTWMMGDVNNPSNNWSMERSKQSKNWIIFWEPGYGENPGSAVDDCLILAEKCFDYYADSLQFIKKGASKTDTYKMIIRYRYTTEWEATGSGVDNTIGLLTLTSWALSSRGGQTIAHEVGHCFQYQVHCDNNDQNGWMYGYDATAGGSNGFWEQCAQWQAYKVLPTQQFTNEWFTGYLNAVHKHVLHETPRYNNFFVQDFWCDLRGKNAIGRLWNESIKPEDPVEAYKRLYGLTQNSFNDEMYLCAARFASWDIPAIKSLGASTIAARPQPKMNNVGGSYWLVDSTVCLENYGHNILKLNASILAKTVSVDFEGKAGSNGFRKNFVGSAGWRFGFVALKKDGTRVYSEVKSANMTDNGGKARLLFDCPENTERLWLVVSGAPSTHWRHAWDDNDANDEQWPYQVKFGNTNLYGNLNVPMAVSSEQADNIQCYTASNTLYVEKLPLGGKLLLFDLSGKCLLQESLLETSFSTTLPMGVYLLKVVSADGHFERKVLIH